MHRSLDSSQSCSLKATTCQSPNLLPWPNVQVCLTTGSHGADRSVLSTDSIRISSTCTWQSTRYKTDPSTPDIFISNTLSLHDAVVTQSPRSIEKAGPRIRHPAVSLHVPLSTTAPASKLASNVLAPLSTWRPRCLCATACLAIFPSAL